MYQVVFSQVSIELIILVGVGIKPLLSILATTWSFQGTGKVHECFTDWVPSTSVLQIWAMTWCARSLWLVGSYWQHAVGRSHGWEKQARLDCLREESLREALCASLEKHRDPFACFSFSTTHTAFQLQIFGSSRFWAWNGYDSGMTRGELLCTRISTHIGANKLTTRMLLQVQACTASAGRMQLHQPFIANQHSSSLQPTFPTHSQLSERSCTVFIYLAAHSSQMPADNNLAKKSLILGGCFGVCFGSMLRKSATLHHYISCRTL